MKEATANWEQLALKAEFKPALLAKQCGVSLRTLQRHFKRHYGIAVSQWMRKLRMREAYARLREGQRVKEVAIDLAYKQVSHFSRDFKTAYGIPPSSLTPIDRTWHPVLPGHSPNEMAQIAAGI